MTCNEFITSMKSYGVLMAPAASTQSIAIANSTLQNMHLAILPKFIIDFYMQCGGMNLGSGYIFGPTEITRKIKYPIPSLAEINSNLLGIPQLRGKTLFGRNDLFWFVFDAFGGCMMLDNIKLTCLRKYEDPYRAMTDCLIAGKI